MRRRLRLYQHVQRCLFATRQGLTPPILLSATCQSFPGDAQRNSPDLFLGNSKSRYPCLQFQTRYFSPALPADPGEGITEGREFDKSSATARQSRHKMLRKRRQNLKQATAVMKRRDMENQPLPKYQRADFADLFDRIVPQHSLEKVDELIRKLEQAVKDTTVTSLIQEEVSESSKKKKRVTKKKIEPANSLPLSTVLRGMLNVTNPNNRLQVQVLELP